MLMLLCERVHVIQCPRLAFSLSLVPLSLSLSLSLSYIMYVGACAQDAVVRPQIRHEKKIHATASGTYVQSGMYFTIWDWYDM